MLYSVELEASNVAVDRAGGLYLWTGSSVVRPGTPDATGVGTGALFLRSDRAGQGDGRVYHVAFEARDVLGAACARKVTVCVPHDAGKGAACGDGGGVVDSSFGG